MVTPIPRHLNFITGNAKKLAEVRTILEPGLKAQGITIDSQSVDVDEIQGTIEEVSRRKAEMAAAKFNGPVLVEDTCLAFDALGGLPGPYIKHFLGNLGASNLHLLLAGFDNKSAQAVCTFAYTAGPSQPVLIFQGRTHGKLVPARGPQDFGWDCAFEYEGKTYAEMRGEEKNKISHRGKALAKLREWLESGGTGNETSHT